MGRVRWIPGACVCSVARQSVLVSDIARLEEKQAVLVQELQQQQEAAHEARGRSIDPTVLR